MKKNIIYIIFLVSMFAVILSGCSKDGKGESVVSSGIVTTVYDNTTNDQTPEDEGTSLKDTIQPTSPPDTTTPDATTTTTTTTTQATTVQTTTPPMSYNININTPQASGSLVQTMNGYSIDYSNNTKGYVMIKNTTGATTYIWVVKGQVTYQYKLQNTGGYETIPITLGSGSYTIQVLALANDGLAYNKNTLDLNINIENPNSPFLYPSIFVNYNANSTSVDKSYQICYGIDSQAQKTQAIYNYIVAHISYNYDRASQITSGQLKGYIPSPDVTLSTGTGICSDYASLMATMCRAQGIPTKMIYGYVNGNAYHAWNEVYYDGSWHRFDSCFGATGGLASSYTNDKQY